MIPVRLGSRLARFALDTGASITVIAPQVAAECGIETTPSPSLTGGGGVAVMAAAGVIPELSIGCVTLSSVRTAAAEFLGMLSEAIGTPIDGILGSNVLRRFRLTIDCPKRRVRLS
jgi:predicted aspartyl protease